MTNGHSIPVVDTLAQDMRALLADHESKAAALRQALAALTSPADPPLVVRADGREPAGTTKAAIRARRARTAAFLAQFTPTRPLYIAGGQRFGLGPLIAAGYLAQKGHGWVRTAKPYHVDD